MAAIRGAEGTEEVVVCVLVNNDTITDFTYSLIRRLLINAQIVRSLLRVKQTSEFAASKSAFDPTATLAVDCSNGFDAGFSSIKVPVCAAKMPSPKLGGWTMNFREAIKSGFGNYVTFSGRAARSEFWYWILFAALADLVGGIIDGALGTGGPIGGAGLIGVVITLALLLPGVAVSVRRLHDLDRTGWWVLIAFTGIGIILLIVWNCMKGTTGSNRFGADPLAT